MGIGVGHRASAQPPPTEFARVVALPELAQPTLKPYFKYGDSHPSFGVSQSEKFNFLKAKVQAAVSNDRSEAQTDLLSC